MKIIRSISSEKRAQFERLLAKGTVMAFVDARKGGVCVPPQHMGNPQLPLNFDYAFQIPDFRILNHRIEVSLSFNKKDFFCIIPFHSIYAFTSRFTGEIVVFPDSVPKEIFSQTFDEGPPSESSVETTLEKIKKRPSLTVVRTQKEEKPPEKKKKKPSSKKKKGSHLKLVK